MDISPYAVLIGFLVGSLVGLTGLGGGVLLLPLLILGLRIPAIVAVGSGAVLSAITKIAGATLHWREGNVDWRLGLGMAVGSVPGSLVGVKVLSLLRARWGDGINDFLTTFIGILLIGIPVLMFLQGHKFKKSEGPLRDYVPHWIHRYHGAIITGLVGGFLVGMTSIGSGSVIMMFLLLFYRRPPAVLVGTDIFHGVILMAVAGAGHLALGTVDLRLVGWLLIGSIPGVLAGSWLAKVVAAARLRHALLLVLLITGVIML